MASPSEVSIVIPAFNEADAIAGVVGDLRAEAEWHEILVVDDGSDDGTAAQAEAVGARVVRQPYNKGNGAAVKAGIRAATGSYLLIVDGDGQHKPSDAVRLVSRLGEYDLVVGARSAATQAGVVRRVGNALLNWLAGYLAERPIPDLTSGFRGARLSLLRELLFLLPNGFSTPTTTTLAFIKAGHSVLFEPIDARQRTGHSKIRLSSDGLKFLVIILRVITIYSPMRIFLPVAGGSFLVGAAYAAWTIATQMHIANSSVLLIMFGVVVFLVGLVSEQIAAQRFDARQ
ncbi:MAG: glycosyltransferase family 2 protein [Acidobacteria bacterium]|jgi:glycosyltransferase involved in cell wall biosynthesis|nr:glycosyltransferase family 2 protein [Acidobacteriota bacterium]